MKWVTPEMIAAAAGKHVGTVRRALRIAGLMPPREPGVQGKRIEAAKANRFISRQWPGTPLFS